MNGKLKDRISLMSGLCLTALGLVGCVGANHGGTPGTAVHDAALSRRVAAALKNDPDYKFNDVLVNIHATTAQLGGFVDTPRHRERAEEVAARVSGVENVINHITLKEDTNAPEEPPTRTSALHR
jgi:hypothetical protein